MEKIHEYYAKDTYPLHDGYAPFCKHLFVENFVGTPSGVMEITEDNVQLLRSDYIRRRPEELAVLTRYRISATRDGIAHRDPDGLPEMKCRHPSRDSWTSSSIHANISSRNCKPWQTSSPTRFRTFRGGSFRSNRRWKSVSPVAFFFDRDLCAAGQRDAHAADHDDA